MWDSSNFRNVKIVLALRIGTDRSFHKAGPDIEKALGPVLVFIRGTTNLYEFVERRYLKRFGRASMLARYAGWLYVRFWKVIAHILKLMELTGSQCNRFQIGTERLNRETLGDSSKAVLNALRYPFLAYCEKVSYLTYYGRVPQQFAWQDLRTDFFEYHTGHGHDRSMPLDMFGTCVFGNSGYCRILHQHF